MKLVIAAVALVAAMGSPTEEVYQKLFTEFVQKFEKKYDMDSFFSRYNTFRTNLDFVRSHNAKEGESYKLGMNHMGDVSAEEFSTMLGYQQHSMPFLRAKNVAILNVTAPASIDWVAKGAVTPVKNQGQCGSCWAFSTTGSTEGANFIKNGHLESLSEQELVDCSTAEGNHACNGGLMDFGFEYIKKSGGLCSEASYPYTAKKDTCKTDCGNGIRTAAITGYSDVAPKNEAELKKAVALGPVSVAVEADHQAFQFYKSGVLTGSACGQQLDHGVLVVGYGTEAGQDYWKVKNSWGATWGDEGYLKVGRSDSTTEAGVCGIATQPSYPTFN